MTHKLKRNKINTLYREIINDFMNSKDTDSACIGLFHHLQKLFEFSLDFPYIAKTCFPDIGSKKKALNDKQIDLTNLMLSADDIIHHPLWGIGEIKLSSKILGFEDMSICEYSPTNNMITFIEGTGTESVEDVDPEIILLDQTQTAFHDIQIFEYSVPKVKELFSPEVEERNKFERAIADLELVDYLIKGADKDDIMIANNFVRDYYRLIKGHREIKFFGSRVRDAFSELAKRNLLKDLCFLSHFLYDYNTICNLNVTIFGNNIIKEVHPFTEDFFTGLSAEERVRSTKEGGWHRYIAAPITYIIVEFLLDESNIALVNFCDCCERGYIAKIKKSDQRFCSRKCHDEFHNKRRNESGENRKFKLERIKMNKATPSYF
jgi:hypothetical protein